MIVMILGGLWHGAAWSYMVWGGAHGVLLAIERFGANMTKNLSFWHSKWMAIIKMLIIFHVISLLWLLFVMPDFTKVLAFVEAFQVGGWDLGSPQHIFVVLFYASPVVLYHIYAFIKESNLEIRLNIKSKSIRNYMEPVVLSVMLALIVVNSGTTGAFIYFQF